jgi:L-alanine-DL-glutamate epimerase-like enolase superfamily enzyme
MRIRSIQQATVPLASANRNAYINFSEMTASVVAVASDVIQDGRPVVGYGFSSNGRYGQPGILQDRLLPRLLKAEPAALLADDGCNLDPHKAWAIMLANEKPGGHGERSVAVGVIDMALWDLVAKLEDKPLYRLLAERYRRGPADERVFVYAAGGYYYPGKGRQALQDEIRRYVDLGFSVVKIKIGGAPLAEDLERVEAVLAVVKDGQALAVDANGRFDLETALAYATALEPFRLRWYEEAGDPLDYRLQAVLAERYAPALATGENLFSLPDARNLIRYGGLRPDRDILQFDCALSYGLVEYLRILDMLRQQGWSWRQCIPHGGHQLSLHIAAGLGLGGNESYPGVFQPFGGFADQVPVENGYVRLPDAPGIGLECKQDLYRLLRDVLPVE